MPIQLGNGSLIVRPHDVGDIDEMLLAVRESVAEISPWLPWCHAGYSRADAASFVAFSRARWTDQSQFPFLVFDADTQRVLGGIGLNHLDRTNRLASMGYWIRSGATRRGVASAAARLVAAFGFGQQGLTRIEIAALPTNVASRRVAEKLGARFESIARNRLVMHGKAYDAALYSLVPGDLRSN